MKVPGGGYGPMSEGRRPCRRLDFDEMPSKTRRRCKVCGKHDSEVGAISRRGKCSGCGASIFEQNLDGLHYLAGPYFLHWRRRMAASVGGTLLDDEPPAA